MIVGPNPLEMEMDMDGQTNQVQQVPMQEVDTGPLAIDVLQAHLTLQLRESMDRVTRLRQDLEANATDWPVQRLALHVAHLQLVEDRVMNTRELLRLTQRPVEELAAQL
jgi:hypothetical protein